MSSCQRTETQEKNKDTMTNIMTVSQSLEHGQRTIHNVIRRNLHIISEYKAEDHSEKTKKIFVEHVKNFMVLLHGHHETEEEYWFPTVSKSCNVDLNHFEQEHKELDALWTKINENVSVFKCVPKKDRSQHLQELRQLFQDLEKEMLPHLQAEEDLINATLLEKHLSESEMQLMDKTIAKLGQSHMGKASVGLPLFYYSMNDEEQAHIRSKVPWFVTNLLLPVVWKRSYSKYIPFYFNHPKNVNTNA
jgi:hemerythrin superfamily protein